MCAGVSPSSPGADVAGVSPSGPGADVGRGWARTRRYDLLYEKRDHIHRALRHLDRAQTGGAARHCKGIIKALYRPASAALCTPCKRHARAYEDAHAHTNLTHTHTHAYFSHGAHRALTRVLTRY
jgi:hypothetical protein